MMVAHTSALEQNSTMFTWCLRYYSFAFFLLLFPALAIAQQGATTRQSSKPATAASQSSAAPAANQGATSLRVTTRMVVVDVVATDSKGAPVTNLKADDFTVQEEGQEQSIRAFSFHQPEQALGAASSPKATPTKLPEGYFSNTPQYKTNGALNVILLDSLNSTLLNQASMRDAMIKFMEKLPAGQPIAIYLLGNKLALIQDFTSNPGILRKAIANVKRQGSKALDNAAGTTRMADMPVGSVALYTIMDVPQIAAQLEEFRDQHTAAKADYRVRFTLDALNSLARTLSGYPGRKNLVWISETFPFSIVLDNITSQNNRDFSRDVAATGSALGNAQVAIYPVDARALVGNSDFSVGSDPNPMGKPAIMSSTLDGDMGKNMNREAEERLSSRTTMNDLAEKTGGRAFYNTNNLEGAVQHSLEDGSTYYTLGYYPENKAWDGKFRRIAVKAARPGIKLHYRLGYYTTEPQSFAALDQTQKTNELAKAMSLEFPVSTALLFQAAIVQPTATNKNKVLVNYAVDPHGLTFETENDGLQHASVDCAVVVYSMKGESVQAQSNTMIAALKPEEYSRVMQKSFPCRQTLDLAPGQYLLRLGVRDAHTGVVGTLNAPVTVTAPTTNGEVLPAEKKP
jgi:VWFA-related protein